MTDPVQVDALNKVLAKTYGENLRGQPIFRIVFSADQREKRFGTFNEFYKDIFLRSTTEVREVPKYPSVHHKWVLERWQPPELAFTPEIPDSTNGSYEPIFVFQDEFGNELPVIEHICHEFIWHLFHIALPGHRQSQLRTEDETALAKEIQYNEDSLDISIMASKLSRKDGNKEGIGYTKGLKES